MKKVFADAFYWLALANSADQWHPAVIKISQNLENVHLVTTEEVLTEFLTGLSGMGPHLRRKAVLLLNQVQSAPGISVIPQSHESFSAGVELYSRRPDKSYSLTDCISMNFCRAEGITDILTNDHHFTQEGFTILVVR